MTQVFTMKNQALLHAIMKQTDESFRFPMKVSQDLQEFYRAVARDFSNRTFTTNEVLNKWYTLVNSIEMSNESRVVVLDKAVSIDGFLKKMIFPYSTHFWVELSQVYQRTPDAYLGLVSVTEANNEAVVLVDLAEESEDITVETVVVNEPLEETVPVVSFLARAESEFNDGKTFESMTIRQLQAFCDEKFIDLSGAKTKKVILEIITNFYTDYYLADLT